MEATAKARQHFLDLGQKEVIDVFFDERKLELQQLEVSECSGHYHRAWTRLLIDLVVFLRRRTRWQQR